VSDSIYQRAEPRIHHFDALAFEQNFGLKELGAVFPEGKLSPRELAMGFPGGDLYVYPFGAVVFHDVPAAAREAFLARLRGAWPDLVTQVQEDVLVREDASTVTAMREGVLTLDRVTPARAITVALTVAQSAAMEYYEAIVERLFRRTDELVDRLQSNGTVPLRVKPLHRFIGEAIGVRNEVLSILHLLDKPDETWDDPALDRLYHELRSEFDLADRYAALTSKLRGVQEALELVLDVARDRRLVLLEMTVVVLIVLELVQGFWKAL